MAAYMHGNLAVEPRREQSQKVKIKESRKLVYRTKTLPTKEKLLYLFLVAILVIGAGYIMWRYAQIYQMNANMMNMQKTIKTMEAENMSLKQQVDKLQSPERLKEEAVKYGMVPSDESVQTSAVSRTTAAAAQPQQRKGVSEAKAATVKKTSAPASGAKAAITR